METFKRWSRRFALGLLVTIGLGIVVLFAYQWNSDGPRGPLTGGPFTSGEIVEAPVSDWRQLEGGFEFELIGHGTSRTAGGILVDGTLYISCDLGFIWSRRPAGLARYTARLIWLLKTWHEKALMDGRIRIRKDGRIYSAILSRVEDPERVEVLKAALEELANEYFAPAGLGPRPTGPPDDVWFFRVSQN